MQIFTLNITRVVWSRVTNLLDLWYFCQHNPLFYHLNLIPKTKTVLAMTDMTESIKAKFLSFVSRCSHVWCRSRRFNCILLVLFRRWGRLVMRDLIKQDALLWLVVFSTALTGAFRSLLFTQWFAPSAVRCRTVLLLLCFLIVGIHASGISIPLSLLILLGWSLIWIASLTLCV